MFMVFCKKCMKCCFTPEQVVDIVMENKGEVLGVYFNGQAVDIQMFVELER